MTDTTTDRIDRHTLTHDLTLRTITAQLAAEMGDHFTKETIRGFVDEVYEELDRRFKVKPHLATFAHRFSRDRLRALARHEGHIVDHTPTVLFVCARNDGVSQMAAALFAARVGERAVVHSAGTAPAEELLDETVLVLNEIGIAMLEAFPKPLTVEIEREADVIVTLDAHDEILVVENDTTQYYAWRTADDHDDDLPGYRNLRDALLPLVDELAGDLVDGPLAEIAPFDD